MTDDNKIKVGLSLKFGLLLIIAILISIPISQFFTELIKDYIYNGDNFNRLVKVIDYLILFILIQLLFKQVFIKRIVTTQV